MERVATGSAVPYPEWPFRIGPCHVHMNLDLVLSLPPGARCGYSFDRMAVASRSASDKEGVSPAGRTLIRR